MVSSSTEHILCLREDIPERGSKGFEHNGMQLFAVRKRGEIYLYENRCPHVGLPLNWQPDQFLDVDRELILCTSHGALFQIENGHCVAGPCPGRKLQAVPYTEKDGAILIADRP